MLVSDAGEVELEREALLVAVAAPHVDGIGGEHGTAGHEHMKTREGYYGSARGPIAASNAVKPDRVLTFDKVTNVHFSGTRHDEDQPVHLRVADTHLCVTQCTAEFGNPFQNFCPANVYEIVADDAGNRRLQINAANCVHCKACDIKDPYAQITWVTPEGGSGPNYQGL